jgi:hypothetical protein
MSRLCVDKQCPLAALTAGVLRHAGALGGAGRPRLAAIAVSPGQRRQVRRLLLAWVASVLNTAVILMVLAETDQGLRFTALGLL